jgi:hypothetical protein
VRYANGWEFKTRWGCPQQFFASPRFVQRGYIVPGWHEVEWNGTNDAGLAIASGIYFYRLQVESQAQMRKMILMR